MTACDYYHNHSIHLCCPHSDHVARWKTPARWESVETVADFVQVSWGWPCANYSCENDLMLQYECTIVILCNTHIFYMPVNCLLRNHKWLCACIVDSESFLIWMQVCKHYLLHAAVMIRNSLLKLFSRNSSTALNHCRSAMDDYRLCYGIISMGFHTMGRPMEGLHYDFIHKGIS